MSTSLQDAVYRAARLYVEQHRPSEQPLFEVLWAAAKDSLADLNQKAGFGSAIFGRLIGISGAVQSAEDWASPFVIAILAALFTERPLGRWTSPNRDAIKETLERAASQHRAPLSIAHQLVPIAEQLYQLRVDSAPLYKIEDYYDLIDNEGLNELSVEESDQSLEHARHPRNTAKRYDIVMRISLPETSECRVDGREIALGLLQTRFVATLLLRRGRRVSYVELDYAIDQVSLHVNLEQLWETVVEKASAYTDSQRDKAKERIQQLKKRLGDLENGALLHDLIGVEDRSGYFMKPGIRFCVMLPGSRTVAGTESSRS